LPSVGEPFVADRVIRCHRGRPDCLFASCLK
jgi:hypothetical protein